MEFSGRQQGLAWLDDTGGLWQVPRELVPLPHERLRLTQVIEKAQLPGRVDRPGHNDPLSAHEIHSTFLPLWQTFGELHAKAKQEQRRCIVGVSGLPVAGASDFVRLLAAVLSQDSECEWAPTVPCSLMSTEGYISDDVAKEPLASSDAYDCARLAADIMQLRSEPGKAVHEVGRLGVVESESLVLVHGPHVLRREGAWAALDDLFDFTMDIQRIDDGASGGREGQDGVSAPSDVESRVLAARLELSRWECRAPASLDVRFQQQGSCVLFIPEALTIVPELRRQYSLLSVGLNPSYQKSLQMSGLAVGEVNRASKLTVSVGGKGQHFALAANRLAAGSASVAHFLGRKGEEGRQLHQRLEEAGVHQQVQWHEGATRTCTTILEDSGRSSLRPQCGVEGLEAV